MGSVNKAILVGNLGKDPELKDINGTPMCKFSIATSESYNNAQGERQERTEWHNIVVWGKQAEACAKYLQKGRSVYVEGSIQTRSWDGDDGQKHYMTEIKAHKVVFLGGQNSGQGGGSGQRYGQGARDSRGLTPRDDGRGPGGVHGNGQQQSLGPDEDDIPF